MRGIKESDGMTHRGFGMKVDINARRCKTCSRGIALASHTSDAYSLSVEIQTLATAGLCVVRLPH